MLCWVFVKAGATTASSITGHDGGTAWAQIGTTQSYSNISGSLWAAHSGSSPSSGTTTVTIGGTSRAQANFAEVAGIDVSGTAANSFSQTDSGTGYASSIARTLTGATSMTMGFWGADLVTITPEGTVVNQLNHPDTAMESAIDYNSSGDATPTATLSSAGGYVSFAVELKAASGGPSASLLLINRSIANSGGMRQ